MKNLIAPVTFLAVMFSCSSTLAFGKKKITPDPTPTPILSGDATVLIEGCGNQTSVGFAYCRVREGDASDSVHAIQFLGPPAKCRREDGCVFFKVFDNRGQIVWGGSIPKGQTRVKAPWRSLLGCGHDGPECLFSALWRGTWAVNQTVYWVDDDGRDRESFATGDIVLRVFKSGYVPLHNSASDPFFAWTWSEGKKTYRITSNLRAFVGVME